MIVERNAVCDELSAQFAAGRLPTFELDQRLSFAVNARTRVDLQRLTARPAAAGRSAACRPPAVAAPMRAAYAAWTGLDIVSLLALIGALPLALLGAMIVVGSVDQSTAWIAVLDHPGRRDDRGGRGAPGPSRLARHDARIRAELRASGDDSRR